MVREDGGLADRLRCGVGLLLLEGRCVRVTDRDLTYPVHPLPWGGSAKGVHHAVCVILQIWPPSRAQARPSRKQGWSRGSGTRGLHDSRCTARSHQHQQCV